MTVTTKPVTTIDAERRTMTAVVREQYGSAEALRLTELDQPVPSDDEVLVRVHAASLNAADGYLLRGKPFVLRLSYGLFRPKVPVLGSDIAGRVEAVGSNVTRFQPGDDVFGDLSSSGLGGFAECARAPERILARKPASLSFSEAAAVPMAATTALQGLRKGQIGAGQKVLIHGASGGVGTFAVQLARVLGAEVTAVCSTAKVELMRSLGADYVIDYTKQDFVQSNQRYDLILAVNGDRSIREYQRALSPNGICVLVGGSMRQIFQAMLLGPLVTLGSKQKIINLLAQPNAEDLAYIGALLDDRSIIPVIDRSYTLSEVPQALQYLAEGRAKGKVIITV
jgi:NADPH:quinone reductase-like Zn-dependent oxidoreductase